MAIHGMDSEYRFEAANLSILNRMGVSLTVGYDFEEFRQHVAEARPDHPLGDPFNPDLHDLTRQTACWIVGRDENDQIMHLHALRMLPLEGQSVAEYFRRNFQGYSPTGLDIDFERSRYRACPSAKRMYGRAVYSGEVWLGGEPGKYRGTGVIGLLMRYGMLTTIRQFSADYMLGFMLRQVTFKGASLRFGYMHIDPLALRWYLRNEPDPLEAGMVYMNQEDMRYIMDLPSTEMEALAA